MDSARIICPHCRNALNLPAQLEVMREVHQGGGYYIAFGDPDRKLPCPSCGQGIRIGDIIEGKHSPKPGGWPEKLAYLLFFGIMLLGLLHTCSR